MENNGNTPNDKKCINKVRSFHCPPVLRLTSDTIKRKSFNVNEAVKSLDLALGRLKKSKLVNGECKPVGPGTEGTSDMFMEICNSSHFNQCIDNASLMSMNFSHYELLRNLSRSNCNSDGAFSGNTSSLVNNADNNGKDEHLERYFRSVEMWTRNRAGGPSNIHFEFPEK